MKPAQATDSHQLGSGGGAGSFSRPPAGKKRREPTAKWGWIFLQTGALNWTHGCNPERNSNLIYGLLLGVWVLVVAWQIEEHIRVREAARTDLRKRSEAIANTIGAVVRGQQFRGAVFRTRLEPVLDELVASETNGPVTGEVISIAMLNASNKVMASAGRTIDLEQTDILQVGEHWGLRTMTRVYPVEGVFLNREGDTNSQAPVILDQPTNSMRGSPRTFCAADPRRAIWDQRTISAPA